MNKIITFIIIFLFFLPTFSQTINENLLIHYKFDGDTNDSSGNNYNGTPIGGAYTVDRFGNENSAFYFDGIDDYIDLLNISELKPDLPVSFSFWIKYNSTDFMDQEVFDTSFEDDKSSGIWFNSQSSTGKYSVSFGNNTSNFTSSNRRTFVSEQIIEVTNWHHIAIVIQSIDDIKIYIDCEDLGGVYSGSAQNLNYSSTPGSIGRHDRNTSLPANYFNGILDDFRYWNKSLTIDEINQLCNSTLSVAEHDNPDFSIIIYPNPAGNLLFLNSNSIEIEKIKIFNSLGQVIYTSEFNSIIDISNLKTGLYYINLISSNGVITKQFLKNN